MAITIQALQFDVSNIKIGQALMLRRNAEYRNYEVKGANIPYKDAVISLVQHVDPLKLVCISLDQKGDTCKHVIGVEDVEKIAIRELIIK